MTITDNVSGFAHDAVDKMTNSANHAADVLGEKAQQLKKGEEHVVKDCQNYVRDNPITSLGIAVAAGFLLSRLLSSR